MDNCKGIWNYVRDGRSTDDRQGRARITEERARVKSNNERLATAVGNTDIYITLYIALSIAIGYTNCAT